MSSFRWTDYRAVLFDLDGVLTPTATVHAEAWKRAFDEFLDAWAHSTGTTQEPFDVDADYRAHVDGRPRYDGVAAFLGSRGIDLPWGDPGDPPGFATICAVGNLKNELVTEILQTRGIEAYPGSLRLIDALEDLGLTLAVVSASANAGAVLEGAGIARRFQVRVDGVVASELGLAGKPRPDPFLEAARRAGVEPADAVVVEDAVAGVEAGVAGEFGAVIGVDRHDDPAGLETAGATLVVADLDDLVP